MAMQVSRPRDDLDAFYHQYMYKRDEETRRSTGSIYESNEIPVRTRHQGMHFRSNSDTSEINVSFQKGEFDIPIAATETRSPTGESFFALVRKFEKNINDQSNHMHIDGRGTTPPHQGHPYTDGLQVQLPPFKGGPNLPAGSPALEKRTPVLKRKNSFKSNTSIFSMLKSSTASRSSDDGSLLDRLQTRKAISHYDCQSLSLDFEEIAKARARHSEVRGRKNTRSGASAASSRLKSINKPGSHGSDSSIESGDEAIDLGDSKTSELVLSCAYFRNELGGEYELDPQIGLSRDNTAFQNPHDPSRPKEFKIDRIQKRRSTLDILLTAYDSARRGNLRSGTGVTVLDNSKPDSGMPLYFGEGTIPPDEGKVVFEHVDHGAFYYRNFFFGQEHQNYLGIDDKFGPIAVSVKREKLDEHTSLLKNESDSSHGTRYQYRAIVRTSELTTLRCCVLEECIPSTARHGTARSLPTKDILEYVASDLQLSALKLAQPGPKVPEQLMKLDEQGLTNQYKVGVIYCKANQNTEEEMYNNQSGGPAFDEFLELIGKRVELKGFEGYRAQLDNKNDSTGKYSCYTKFNGREIMFHVSTLLPWTPNNKQQLLRKRHIGNDIVTIVFQEPGALPFTPKNIRSHFQHVFIVIQVFNPCSENTYYKVAVSRSKDVPPFGPPIPSGAKFGKQKAFANFLLTKVINAENAAHKSEKFSAMATRTRLEYLRDLANNFVTGTTLETGGKSFGKFLGSNKKKEKVNPGLVAEKVYRGALQWNVQVEDYRSSHMIECIMGISADTLVLIDCSSKEALFSIPTKAVIGWTPLSQSIKVFYGGGDCLILNIPSSDTDDIPEIVRRLEAVTIGCQTQTLVLRRNPLGQLGFHVQSEGLVAEVESAGLAFQAGLRTGCRLVEINSLIVATVSHDQMIDILRKPGSVSAVVIPPLSSGKPRKGVQQSNHWWSSRSSGTISSPFGSTSSVIEEHDTREQHMVDGPPRKTSALRLGPKPYSKVKENPWIMRANEAVDKELSSYNQRASAPSTRTSSNSARSTPTGSTSSVGGSAPNLNEISAPTYGASYTVTNVVATPHTLDNQAYSSHWSKPSTVAHATHVASSNQEVYINGKNKWTGVVSVDFNIKDPTQQLAVSYSASGTPGTLYAPATSPTTPVSPDTPLFGSTSQRHDHRFRKVVIDDHGEPVVVEEEIKRGSGEIRVFPKDEQVSFRIPNSFEQLQTGRQRSSKQEPTDERSGRHSSSDRHPPWARSKGELSDSERSNVSDKSGSLDRHLSSRVSSGRETPRQRGEQSDDGEISDKPRLPYKETSLGAVVTTVETYKQNFDEGETALSENIVDQIEKAFGFKTPQMSETPRKVAHGSDDDEPERTSCMRRSKSDSGSLTEVNGSSKLSMSENSLNRHSSTDERNSTSKEELLKERDTRIVVTSLERKDQSTTVAVGETPEGLTISVRKRDPGVKEAVQNEVTLQNQTTVAASEPTGKSKDIDPQIAARKVLIERLENNRQAMQHNGIEGVRIYHTKSRSTPVVMDKLDKINRHASSQEDLSGKRLSSQRKSSEQRGSSPRRKKSDNGRARSPSTGRSPKPVVRSERKIKLTQSHAAFSANGAVSGSQTVPRYRPSRRNRHVAKQQMTETDSDEEEVRKTRERSKDRNREKETKYSSATVPGHLIFTPDASKKSASLPRDLGSSASRHSESRSHHHGSASHMRGARIAKIKLSSSEDPSESIVDQTAKLLSAASNKDTSYEMATSLVIAEDVLNSLTRTSALLKNQVSSKEEKEKERRERHASKIKSSGRGRSHGPHKFHIPVVPRRHSFDERIFAQTSGRSGQSGESTLTRESIGREAELEMKLAIVSNALMKEGEERQRCESELRKCQKDNRRLQEELRTASAQLRKFTEWFFASVEQHNT